MNDISPVKGISIPVQSRSQKTLNNIVDATIHIISTKSFEQTKVSEICRQANVTSGAFYARFTEKKDLLFLLIEQLRKELNESVDRFSPCVASVDVDLVDFFGDVLLVFRRNAGLIHTIISQAYQHEDVALALRQLNTEVFQKLESALSELGSKPGQSSPISLRFALLATMCALRDIVFDNLFLPGEVKIPDNVIATELANILRAHVRIK